MVGIDADGSVDYVVELVTVDEEGNLVTVDGTGEVVGVVVGYSVDRVLG